MPVADSGTEPRKLRISTGSAVPSG
jgi:hypothetical protein